MVQGSEKREVKKERGFTLWEISLVLFLAGLVLAMAVPRFDSAPDQVRKQVDLSNKKRIEGAVQLYRIDVGVLPVCVEDLLYPPEGVKGWRGPYLREIPPNPFNAAGVYLINDLGQVP